MNRNAAYTPYHPRWHRRRVSTYWWLGRRSYFLFILREVSSLAVGWFVAFLLLLVRAVSGGAVRYQDFLEWARHPVVLALNIACFLFVCLHAVTWFNLAPQAMVVRVGGTRVPGWVIAASNYAALAATTAVVVALLLLRW
jgi:succinate dehydrogenase subunit C